MRIALVHDWLNNLGGAERVLIELHEIFPEAPIYTLFYNKKFTDKFLSDATIVPSWLQKFPLARKYYQYLLPLMPAAIESFDLSDFDVVLSSSINFAKGLVLKPKTKHICYCYSPTRFLWDRHFDYEKKSWPAKFAQHLLRIWDRQAADRVDKFVAISEHVKRRINKYYGKDSEVVYPPVNNFKFSIFNFQSNLNDSMFKNSEIEEFNENSKLKILNSDYYLIVSRLYPHKNIDIAIEAFNKLNLPLLIIGDGPEKHKLQSKIENDKNIKLLGFIPDEDLASYYQNCRAFIMPQEEDFGLTPIEAMSFGKPVLALRRGGATETIIEGVAGEFFDDPIPEALADGIRRLNENYNHYDPALIQKSTEKFSLENFREKMLKLVS